MRIRLDDGDESEPVVVPASALRLFMLLLVEFSQGNAVTLVPTHAEFATQQAADLLNVSRPYVVKLLDEGKIPCRTVGKYRRVRYEDLIAFKRKDDETRARVLDQLTAEAQELGMGHRWATEAPGPKSLAIARRTGVERALGMRSRLELRARSPG